jgi:hypothetical protein
LRLLRNREKPRQGALQEALVSLKAGKGAGLEKVAAGLTARRTAMAKARRPKRTAQVTVIVSPRRGAT